MNENKPDPKWNTDDNHSPLVSYLNSFVPLSKDVIALIDDQTFPLSISKGKLL